jgi:hypothetical protein
MVEDDRSDAPVGVSKRLLRLRHLMAREMLHEHWAHVAEITGCADLISQYPALGDRHWGGSSYDAGILHFLSSMMERSPDKLTEVEQFVDSLCSDKSEFTNATLARR